ncbi:MAG: pyrroline-5-carboxylate reductase family protein [bacterium]
MKIFIIGAGRMGALLAKRLHNPEREIWLSDVNALKAYKVAKQAGCSFGSVQLAAGAQVVVLALPAEFTLAAAKDLKLYLKAGTLVVNIATKAATEPLQRELAGINVQVVGVKFIGHAQETLQGEIPLLVADTENDEVFALVSDIFNSLGPVVKGAEELVEKINTLATEESIKAAVNIRKGLTELGIGEDMIQIAIANTGAGSMKAFSRGDLGGFARQLLNE